MKPADRPDVFDYLDYRAFLRDHYLDRKAKSGLSYRRFARAAGVRAPNYLKLVIDGSRNLSERMAARFAEAAELEGDDRAYFLALVSFNQAKSSSERSEAYARLSSFRRYQKARPLEAAHAEYHSRWYLPAIRELAAAKGFRGDPDWIATQLIPPISREEASEALEILLSLGLLRRDARGRLRQGESLVSTGPNTASVHVPTYHRAMMAGMP